MFYSVSYQLILVNYQLIWLACTRQRKDIVLSLSPAELLQSLFLTILFLSTLLFLTILFLNLLLLLFLNLLLLLFLNLLLLHSIIRSLSHRMLPVLICLSSTDRSVLDKQISTGSILWLSERIIEWSRSKLRNRSRSKLRNKSRSKLRNSMVRNRGY